MRGCSPTGRPRPIQIPDRPRYIVSEGSVSTKQANRFLVKSLAKATIPAKKESYCIASDEPGEDSDDEDEEPGAKPTTPAKATPVASTWLQTSAWW